MDRGLDAKPRFERFVEISNGDTRQETALIINAIILSNDCIFRKAPCGNRRGDPEGAVSILRAVCVSA